MQENQEYIGEAKPFILGVNYWPRRKAMYWWSDFDAWEVRDDFSLIRELGLQQVRIFLLWEDWQPSPTSINHRAMDHLRKVCDIAADLGLHLNVTFFTGHMSGPSWVPAWMLQPDQPKPTRVFQVVTNGKAVDCGYLNPFTDGKAIAAAELFLTTVVDRFKDHPAIGIWNLGNEPDLFARPVNADGGRSWVRRMTHLIRQIDAHHAVTCGLHIASLLEDNDFRINDVFAEVDIPVMHAYPMYIDWAIAPLDSNFAAFTCALTSALCGKPVLMEEFGGCTEMPGVSSQYREWYRYGKPFRQFMASEEDLAQYLEKALPKIVQVGALGALVWCFADYAAELYDRPPCDQAYHERFFGLVRPDGTLKPHAELLKRFAATEPKVQPLRPWIKLGMTAQEFYQAPEQNTKRLYRQFLQTIEQRPVE